MEGVRINQAVVGVRFSTALQDNRLSSTSRAGERIDKSLLDQLNTGVVEVNLKSSEVCLTELRSVAFLGSLGPLGFTQSCFLFSSHACLACLSDEYELLLLLVEDKLESFEVSLTLN